MFVLYLLRGCLITKNKKRDYNKNTYTSKNIGTNQATVTIPRPKLSSFRSEDPYDYINHMEITHGDTHLIDKQEQDIENTEVEQ